MGWCPKAEFLNLYENLAFSLCAQSCYTHGFSLIDILSFILHAIMTNKASL